MKNNNAFAKKRIALAVLGALAWLGAAQASAEDAAVSIDEPVRKAAAPQHEQVIVLARSRVERMQDVPIPVTAVNGKTLDRYDAVTIQDVSKLAPNLLVQAP